MTFARMKEAGVSVADIRSMWAVRNSQVRYSPLYKRMFDRAFKQVATFESGKAQAA